MTDVFPPFPVTETREAFLQLPDRPSHIATQAPNWAEVFTPDGHEGALDPHRAVVIGDRGTGKSFWSSVLTNNDTRLRIAKRYPRLSLEKVQSRLGFSDAQMAAEHPSPTEISDIISRGYSAEDIWRAVILSFAPQPVPNIPESGSGWEAVTNWIATDPARRNSEFRALDDALIKNDLTYLLVFDALDVIADNWSSIRAQLQGLIKLALAVRALRRVRIKLFIRPDMADDRRLWMVGDASKLRQDEIFLKWIRRDLYGLLWTLLANRHDGGSEDPAKTFREHFGAGPLAFNEQDGIWRPSRELLSLERTQQFVFRAIAGNYMGAGSSKGDTYKWVPNHLSDAEGNAAPRSFLLAMRTAAEKSKSAETALDKAGIEEGVRKASTTRIRELAEDYKWMEEVLGAMSGLVVPITRHDLTERWKQKGTLDSLRIDADKQGGDRRYIPPGEVLEARDEFEAYSKLIDEMITLRIFLEIPDGRINMPDLFRVEAKVKRKGGMKPRA